MANDLDEFPVDDNLIRPGSYSISEVWRSCMATFLQNLKGYLTSYGIFVPPLTLAQRTTIQSPQNGQIIFNTDSQVLQIFQNGAWKTVTTS